MSQTHASTAFDRHLDAIERLASLPEHRIDLLEAKLAIDTLIDPTLDIAAARRELDTLQDTILARIPPAASNNQKMLALMEVLYQAGEWNKHRIFRYDLDDPRGTRVTNKLLPRYLETRKGNCVSMPILVTLLGHRLGLNVTLSLAPLHMFAKYQRDDGTWANIEATSGGYKLDASYVRELEITDLALREGTYLRPLTRRESVATMLESLLQHLRAQRDWDRIMQVTDVALRLYPNDTGAWLSRYGVYAGRVNDLRNRYVFLWDLPPAERANVRAWDAGAKAAESRARALGWVPPSPEVEASYQRSAESAKAAE